MKNKTKIMYCSQCKKSKYVVEDGQRRLHCSRAEAFGLEAYLPTNCSTAGRCPLFEPERARKKSFSAWKYDMQACRIPMREYMKETY